MGWTQKTARWLVVFAVLAATLPVSAEIYRWVDASEKMHFTQDLAKVPMRYRADSKARADAPKADSPVQHYTPSLPPASLSGRRKQPDAAEKLKTHHIRVQRAGASMRVMVRINGELDVPFIIDTGATDVVLPMSAAKQLGLAVDGPDVRMTTVQTANGLTQAAVLMLDSVVLGSARVETVSSLALPGMDEGLLGLSFFNHFTYNIDTSRGVVSLTENDLAAEGVLRGGRNESRWKLQFQSAYHQISSTESLAKSAPFGRDQVKAEARREQAVERLRLLEDEADDARVPFYWRN